MNFLKQKLKDLWTVYTVRRNKDSLRVIVGSASLTQQGWISTNYPLLDLGNEETFQKMFRSSGSVHRFMAEHVWEHLTAQQAKLAADHCFKYLAKGGTLRIAVPDGLHPDEQYIEQVRPGGSGPGAHDHKILYDYRTLSGLLAEAGFKVELLEWFDESGQFHGKDWNPDDGMIRRSSRFDPRNQLRALAYTSLIVDATKP